MIKSHLLFINPFHKKPTKVNIEHDNEREINHKADSNIKKRPYLLKYRSTNIFVFLTGSFSIFSSIYLNSSILSIASYVIENRIKLGEQSQLISNILLLSEETIGYILSGFYLAGLLVGSAFFGWLGYRVRQRRLPLLSGTLISILASSIFMVANKYWLLLPAKFLQGLSNCSAWLMSSAMISDVWPQSKWGSMVGLVGGLFPLGLTFGSSVGAIFQYVDHQALFFSALGLNIVSCLLQAFVIEQSSILDEWLQPEIDSLKMQNEIGVSNHPFMQREIIEGEGKWSKSSSMSTINLNQPIIFEKETKTHSHQRKPFKETVLFCLLSSAQLMSLLYQIIIISIIVGALKSSLLVKLESQLNIVSAVSQSAVTSTFLIPCAISAFVNGWLCDCFGPQIISLTSAIICIPAFIWIGVPNQNVQSIVSALVVGGITLAGMTVSVILSIIRLMKKLIFQHCEISNDIRQQQRTTTFIVASICIISGLGFFVGIFFKDLNEVIGFFWLCFLLAMLLLTCIPWMLLFNRKKKKNKSEEDVIVFSQSSSKKSIINNTRPESFAESILSDNNEDEDKDDDSTLGPSVKSVCNMPTENKPVIVVP